MLIKQSFAILGEIVLVSGARDLPADTVVISLVHFEAKSKRVKL